MSSPRLAVGNNGTLLQGTWDSGRWSIAIDWDTEDLRHFVFDATWVSLANEVGIILSHLLREALQAHHGRDLWLPEGHAPSGRQLAETIKDH